MVITAAQVIAVIQQSTVECSTVRIFDIFQLEVRLCTLLWSNIPEKQFITIITTFFYDLVLLRVSSTWKLFFATNYSLRCNEWIFFIWRKNKVSLSRSVLRFFVKSTNFWICDIIIDSTVYEKFYFCFFWTKAVTKWNLVKYCCNLRQVFPTCFELNSDNLKLVPGSVMILIK